jgi:hypothetical protein
MKASQPSLWETGGFFGTGLQQGIERTCLHRVQAVRVWAMRLSGTSSTLSGSGSLHGFLKIGRAGKERFWFAMARLSDRQSKSRKGVTGLEPVELVGAGIHALHKGSDPGS